ncbi:hypothetical protein [Brevundimonas pondensis]|uniref:Poly A polymerase head domain-containing protein n=1 Tax=Brevundimonas pondensis TaxID=2774189 RepID=A0ABX7SL30_9CAUL|nr:hypothetical protein [Brevundimonas pondensis]QTC88391.1 hypothetical protein IFE19_03065 [Brevundimonas pondensis]
MAASFSLDDGCLPFPPLDRVMQGSTAKMVMDRVARWAGGPAFMEALAYDALPSCYLVGGVVRNALSGQSGSKDFDFAVGLDGAPSFLKRLAHRGVLTPGPLGSPRWAPAVPCETADIMVIERFCNGLQNAGSICDMLGQFDLTANAVAIDLRSGQIVDPIGGAADAAARIIRVVRTDYPDTPIDTASPLTWSGMLWIRLWHYAAKLGWEVELDTWAWMTENCRYAIQIDAFSERLFEPDMSKLAQFQRLGA